jgi:protein gp37
MLVDKIIEIDLFKNLLPIDSRDLEAIEESMSSGGYDVDHPIFLWGKSGIVVDGHTRLLAARNVGLVDIPVVEKEFKDEEEVLAYILHEHRYRKKIGDDVVFAVIEVIDKRKDKLAYLKKGEHSPEASSDATVNQTAGKSSAETASIVGTSERKVEKARTVIDQAPEELKEEVRSGKTTINKAYTQVQEQKKAETPKSKPMFNQTNDNIEWAKWSWNPVVGCRHDCSYCYARDIAIRFYGTFEPTFYPERLSAPKNTKPGLSIGERTVFVCSMADLFGEWVDQSWIDSVLREVGDNPQWNFIFLTKNPKRYLTINNWPKNCWIGATADTQERAEEALKVFEYMKDDDRDDYVDNILFLSCEPLNEQVTLVQNDYYMDDYGARGRLNEEYIRLPIDWLIIGGRSKTSGAAAFQPEWEWVESLLKEARDFGCKVYFKPNLEVRPKEYPVLESE